MKLFKNVPYKLKNFDKITKKDNLFKSFRDKMGDECLKFIPKTYILFVLIIFYEHIYSICIIISR